MFKLLGRSTSGNVQKVMWLLDEIGAEYVREDYGRPNGLPVQPQPSDSGAIRGEDFVSPDPLSHHRHSQEKRRTKRSGEFRQGATEAWGALGRGSSFNNK